MPSYRVLHPIEKDRKLYLPEGSPEIKLAPSGMDGKLIPVDVSGTVELTEAEAAILDHQVPQYLGKPDPIDGPVFRKQRAEREATEAEQKRQQQEKEYEEFLQFKAAKANGTAAGTAAAASTDGADAEEPADAPTIKCVALKNFQFKGEKYKEGDERELTFATIQAMGKDKVKVLDVPAYQAAKAAEGAKK